MHNYYDKKSVRNRRAHPDMRAMSKDAGLRGTSGDTWQDTGFLLQHKEASAENGREMPLRYHVNCIARGIWKWFSGLSLPTRIVLILLMLYIPSRLMDMLIQLIIPSLNSIYTILGIIASAIALYEFFIKAWFK